MVLWINARGFRIRKVPTTGTSECEWTFIGKTS